MRIVGLAIIACLLCALKTNAYSVDPDTLSVEAGYGRIVLPGTQVQLNATLTNGPGARVVWRQVQGTPDPSFRQRRAGGPGGPGFRRRPPRRY